MGRGLNVLPMSGPVSIFDLLHSGILRYHGFSITNIIHIMKTIKESSYFHYLMSSRIQDVKDKTDSLKFKGKTKCGTCLHCLKH